MAVNSAVIFSQRCENFTAPQFVYSAVNGAVKILQRCKFFTALFAALSTALLTMDIVVNSAVKS